MFGGTSTGNTGFSFGGTPAATPATSTGFSFGAPATSQPSTGFGFGGTSAPATSTTSTGFGFGGVNTSAPATSTTCTGFGFGGTSAPATNTTGTGFSFGAAPTTPAPSSGFGFGAAAAPSTSSGFGFGNNAAKPSAFGSTTPSAFGATTTPSAFGSTTGTPSAFGSTTTPSAFGSTVPSAFGSTAPSGFGAAPTTFAADSPAESLKAIKLAYSDPQQSRFKHMFYNVVDPTQRQFYVRPGHISERLWKQAEADNPDPMNCVPTAVIGFKELYERIKTQQGHADKLNTFVEGLKATIATMEKACRSTDAQLEQCREQHVLLFHKLIEIMRKIEVYQCLRKPLHPEELRLRASLHQLQNQINQPNMFKSRLNELVSLQRMQIERSAVGRDQLAPSDLETVHNIMKRHRDGLQHLTNIMKRDMRDFELMKKGMAATTQLVR